MNGQLTNPKEKQYSVMYSSGGKKVIYPLVDSGRRKVITSKYGKIVLRIFEIIKPPKE